MGRRRCCIVTMLRKTEAYKREREATVYVHMISMIKVIRERREKLHRVHVMHVIINNRHIKLTSTRECKYVEMIRSVQGLRTRQNRWNTKKIGVHLRSM